MEIVLSATFLVYLLVWYKGKTSNLASAKNWLNGQIDYLEEQFCLVGDKLTNEKSVLMMDGPADYLLYTSGRRNVQFGHWWLKMKPRNDILTYFSTQLLSLTGYAKPANDRVALTMALDKALPEKFVFAVIKKELATDLHKKRFDLKRFGKIASSNIIPSNLIIYSESQKLADILLAGRIGEIIAESSDRLESLIVSSLPAEQPEMYESDSFLTMSLEFLMPGTSEFDPLVELACELPDVISQLRLTGDVRSKINKNREELIKEYSKKAAADRAEEMQRKKAEAKRLEEERVKKMSPAEQRKWDEKERIRAQKKLQKKRKA
ncbi:uncharacterized protein EV154DRAFT_62914 [Mucor mucedo]|uniref:uncharacterized protein n=1 Tax=Mucor mucedo TaxID=29922 RepID=UPI00221FEE23|nr:uncharacterized protein EV154DRAFT_62914 [Mucor mucedo]KAI7877088.1 hypothetical protein EV154DRAFT_62914 [Mucor mucedo]